MVVLFKPVIANVDAVDKLFILFLFSLILICIPVISTLGGGSSPPPPPSKALTILPTPSTTIRVANNAAVPAAAPATLVISAC